MRENKFHFTVSEYEQGLLLNALICMKNDLTRKEKSTEPVDELLIKVGKAPAKKNRLSEREELYER